MRQRHIDVRVRVIYDNNPELFDKIEEIQTQNLRAAPALLLCLINNGLLWERFGPLAIPGGAPQARSLVPRPELHATPSPSAVDLHAAGAHVAQTAPSTAPVPAAEGYVPPIAAAPSPDQAPAGNTAASYDAPPPRPVGSRTVRADIG